MNRRSFKNKINQRKFIILFLALFLLEALVWRQNTYADVIADDTAGTTIDRGLEAEQTRVIRVQNGTRIGNTLFHSFRRFDISNNQQVIFSSAENIADIFTRVTGNQPSFINGKLSVDIGNANLFLINPSGISFGSEASLNLDGSFVASTADAFIFSNGDKFSASNQSVPEMNISESQLIGLNFREVSRPIKLNTGVTFDISENSTLALIGGNILINGSVNITANRIELSSFGSNETAYFQDISQGNLVISSKESPSGNININGPDTNLEALTRGIQIQGQNIRIVDVPTVQTTKLGAIFLNANESIHISNSAFTNLATGKISLRASQIEIGPNVDLIADALEGDSGSIFLRADDSIEIDGPGTSLRVGNINRAGNAGTIEIKANSVIIDNGVIISATTLGREGDIIFNVVEDFILLGDSDIIVDAGPGGVRAGNIDIDVENLVALEDSDIIADAIDSRGGRITINALGVFGTQINDLNFSKPLQDDFDSPTPESEISAISGLGSQFDGRIEINTPDLDPSNNFEDLPEDIVAPETLVSANPCPEGVSSEFIVEGSGGIPSNPGNTLSPEGLIPNDLTEPVKTLEQDTESSAPGANLDSEAIAQGVGVTPAWGWIWNDKGEVLLTAHDPTVIASQRLPTQSGLCSDR